MPSLITIRFTELNLCTMSSFICYIIYLFYDNHNKASPTNIRSLLTERVCTQLSGRHATVSQLKILGGAPEEYRGVRWATGDCSGRMGEEAHSPICPLKLPDKIITGDLWWELLRGPQWEKLTVGPGRYLYRGQRKRIPPQNLL